MSSSRSGPPGAPVATGARGALAEPRPPTTAAAPGPRVSALAPVADAAGALAERTVRGALVTARLLAAEPVPRLAPEGGRRVAVVAPHPDDEVAGCAGTLLAHRAAGDRVAVVVATDGARSRALGLGPHAMRERRRAEAETAAGLLGASLDWLGLAERAAPDALEAGLRDALTRSAPDLVYAPSRIDYHPVHLAVATALARALAGVRVPVRVYQVHVPLGGTLVNRVSDVSRHATEIDGLVRAHGSQWESLRRTLRMRRYAAARHGLPSLAEEFRETSAEAYRSAHGVGTAARGPREGPPPSFRGVRYRPYTDPLAFWMGRKGRRAFLRAEGDGS